MTDALPNCPKCESSYVYEDRDLLVCPECAYEWDPKAIVSDDEISLQIKDSNGNALNEGDRITLIKDLKVKGSSTVLKVGTKAVIKHLVDGDHDLDCKVEGAGVMMLKSAFVKKA
ncbi:MAG: zinc ribbon domain-containing protein YjdM [Gammaproteobacteria bacterium]